MDEALIQKIAQEVIKTLGSGVLGGEPEYSGGPRMLVIGDFCHVPEGARGEYSLAGLEDYEKYRDVGRYCRIYITKLSLADLSNIAMGRDDTAASCAVVNALLRGVEVCLSDRALWYRKLAGKGSSRLYSVIDNNVRQLEGYGVKVIEEAKPVVVQEPKPPKFCPPEVRVPQGSGRPNANRLITESAALEMAKENRPVVQIPQGVIITPSAWDVFTSNRIQVERT